MNVTIRETGLDSCELLAVNNTLPLPVAAETIRGAIEALLLEPEKALVDIGPVQVVRHEHGVSFDAQAGSFLINWRFLYNLVQDPWG
jgi:hypothetical protein